MAQVRIKNLTQHRIYVPVPVGIMMRPAQEVILSEVSDDLLAQSKKISTLVEKRVIQISIQPQDPQIDDSLETRFLGAGGVASHASTHSNGGSDAIDVINLRSTGGSVGDVLTADGAGGLLFVPPGAPGLHAATHQDGGSDEIATAVPGADAIPKATGGGTLAGGWISYGTSASTAAEGNDARFPTTDENDALQGTDGTPSNTNRYVTDSDSRLSDARTPTMHAATHQDGGVDEIATATPSASAIPKADGTGKLDGGWTTYGTSANTAVEGNDTRVPSQDENDALQGTDGVASNTNRYVTNSDSRLSDARAPTAHASTHSDGGADEIDVIDLGSTSAPSSGYLPTSDGVGGLAWQVAGTPAAHASTHQDGGADEVATGTPTANAIPKAASTGKLATGWIDVGTGAGQVAAGDDSRIPTQDENDALVGTGTPSAANVYVTNDDSRLSDARTPTAHSSTHSAGGSDEIDAANLASDSAPSTGYVLASAAGDTCVWTTPSAPGAHATTHSDGGADEVDVGDLGSTSAPGSGYLVQSDGTGGLNWVTASAPGPHASTHQDGGADEIATATAAANAIPKANASGTFNAGWIDDTSHGTRGGGTLHADATTSVDGFMSASDKTEHDKLAENYLGIDEPNGFPNLSSDTTISFVDGTRTFTIAPTGADFDVFAGGNLYTKTSENVVITDTEGLHFIYYDDSGVLSSTQTTTDDLITKWAFVAVIYWDATNKAALLLGDERHGRSMSSATHQWFHHIKGSQWRTGLELQNLTTDASGDLNSHAQFSVQDGTFVDEDIIHTVTDDSPQDLAPNADLPIWYRSGTSGDWRLKTADSFPLIYSGAPAGYTGTLIPYNEFTGTTWQLTELSTGEFVNYHYFATPDINTPIVGLIGTSGYADLKAARDGIRAELDGLLTGLPASEFTLLGTVIFETANGYANAPKARIRAITTGVDYVDWRGTTIDDEIGLPSLPLHSSTHENGGTDELDVTGLSGTLADPQTPSTHASTHQHGGSDEVATATAAANAIPKADGTGQLDAAWIPTLMPALHASTHQDGGSDEIATATPTANAIPKAGAGSTLDGGWIPYGSVANTAVEGDDTRVPSQDENDALQGTDGIPSNSNRYVTNSDSRLSDARTPTAHASTHQDGGSDEIATATPAANAIPKSGAGGELAGGWIPYGSVANTAVEGDDTRVPTQDENDALQGTDGTPGNLNRYVTNTDSRMTDARTPTGTASGQLGGTYPGPDVRGLRETLGPTLLSIGNVADGQFLARSGTSIVGTVPAGAGDVSGPASSTDEAVARYDGTTGKLIQDSPVTISDTGSITVPALETVDGRDVSADGSTLDTHVGDTTNPHSTDIGNLGTGTLAELNAAVTDATLDDSSAARTPTSHATTHQHGGSDEVATATPAANAIPKADGSGTLDSWVTHLTLTSSAPEDVDTTAAAVGVATDAARADHKHDVATASPSTVGTANAEGTATSLARSDHVHDHGAQTSGTLHALSSASAAGFLPQSNRGATTDPTATDDSASGYAVGSLWINVSTDNAFICVDDTASAAVWDPIDSDALLTSSSPADVTKAAAAVGVATTAARADHKHDVTTAAPSANGVATTSTEGTATTLARSDHQHQSNTAPADVTKAAAAIGTSGEPARADHKHDVTTAAASTIGTANTEGSATTLARSDHGHDHGAQTSGTHHAIVTTSVNGFMSAADKTKLDTVVAGDVIGEPTGFPNLTDSTISFDNGTRTFTIAPTGADFTYYRHGELVTKTSENVVLSDVSGLWFIYYDDSEVLTASLTTWDLSTHVPVAIVYWDAVGNIGFLGEERHGIVLDWQTHEYLHRTTGTRYVNGLDIDGYLLDTDNDASVSIGIDDGTIADEDLFHNIVHSATPTNPFEQVLTDPAQIPVLHRDGSNGEWKSDTATDFPFKNTASGRVNYNLFSTTWQQAQATDGYYVAYWIVATNHIDEPVVSIQGQREDATLADAQRNNVPSDINFGDLPFAENRFLWRIIVQTDDTFGGTRKAKIQSVEDYRGFIGALSENLVEQSISGQPGLLADPQTPLSHASTHQHNGSDEIATATPAANAIPKADGSGTLDSWVTHTPLTSTAPVNVTKSAAVAGVATDAARQDHKHDVDTAAPTQGIGGGNVEGTATSLARSDHDHAIRETGGPTNLTVGIIADGQYVQRSGATLIGAAISTTDELVGVTTNDTTPSYLDNKIVGGNGITTSVLNGGADEDLNLAVDFATLAPADVTKAAASIGVANRAAREDHKHDVTTAAATGLSATTTNAEGAATTLARSDHTHAVDTTNGAISTVNGGDTATEGTGTGLARRDHQHAVSTGAASGLSGATTNTEGTSTALARADHTHAIDVTTGTLSSVDAGDAASDGTAAGLARRDHQHAVSTAAPATGVGTGNAEGTSTNLARADHGHVLRETGGPTDLTMATIPDGTFLQRSAGQIVGVDANNVFDIRDILVFDHFVSGNIDSDEIGSQGWRQTSTGAGNELTLIAEAGHPGIVGMNPGTSSSGYYGLHLGDSLTGGTFAIGGTNTIEYEAMIKITGSINATDLEGFTLGFGFNWSTVGQHADGVYIRFFPGTDTTFVMVASNGGTATTSVGTTTVAINTWYRVGFIISTPGTTPSVQMYVNGTAEGTAITTNFPPGNLGFGHKIDGAGATTEPILYVDYVRYTQPNDGED